jgi:hypothetical protein
MYFQLHLDYLVMDLLVDYFLFLQLYLTNLLILLQILQLNQNY